MLHAHCAFGAVRAFHHEDAKRKKTKICIKSTVPDFQNLVFAAFVHKYAIDAFEKSIKKINWAAIAWQVSLFCQPFILLNTAISNILNIFAACFKPAANLLIVSLKT